MPDPLNPLGSPEDIVKQLLMQRGQATLAQSAEKDAAFREQVQRTRAARQVVLLPKKGAIGMDESGAAIRAGQQPTGQADFSGGEYTNRSVARHMARTEAPLEKYFRGKSTFTDVPEIIRMTFEERERGMQEARSAAMTERGMNAARGAVGPGRWKHQLLTEDSVPERDVGLIQGTIETPLGRATPDSGAVQFGPGIESRRVEGHPDMAPLLEGEEVPFSEVLRHLKSRMPYQGA